LAFAIDPFISVSQQSPAKKTDSLVAKDQLPGNFISKDLFTAKDILSGKSILPDSIKKNATQMLTGKMQERIKAYKNLFTDINNDLKRTIESPFSLDKGSISIQGMSSP